MKIDRLIGILTVLMQKEKVTAPYLAEKFEVTRRTINRDIEELCKAGIPVQTTQGAGGGISIMEGYALDRALLTEQEMQEVLAGLRGLDSIAPDNGYKQLRDKLALQEGVYGTREPVLIDLSSYYKSSLAPKIAQIKLAVRERRMISFSYYSERGVQQRIIEPYLIVYRWSAWYVRGYCRERQAVRKFKLNRLWDLQIEAQYEEREMPEYSLEETDCFPDRIQLEAVFALEMKWRLVEEYGPDCYEKRADGCLVFRHGFANEGYLISWLLGFGGKVEVYKPESVRNRMKEEIKQMADKYRD